MKQRLPWEWQWQWQRKEKIEKKNKKKCEGGEGEISPNAQKQDTKGNELINYCMSRRVYTCNENVF